MSMEWKALPLLLVFFIIRSKVIVWSLVVACARQLYYLYKGRKGFSSSIPTFMFRHIKIYPAWASYPSILPIRLDVPIRAGHAVE